MGEAKYHDLEIEGLEKELEVMREEMRLLENEEKELLETERRNVLDREFGVKSAKLNHVEQVKGVNRYNESRFKLVERQRTYSGSYINTSVKKHPVNDENMHTSAGGALVRFGGNQHRLDEGNLAWHSAMGGWAMKSLATDEFPEWLIELCR